MTSAPESLSAVLDYIRNDVALERDRPRPYPLPFVRVVYAIAGSGKSTLVSLFPHLFTDGDFLFEHLSNDAFANLTAPEYCAIVTSFIERLNADTERYVGIGPTTGPRPLTLLLCPSPSQHFALLEAAAIAASTTPIFTWRPLSGGEDGFEATTSAQRTLGRSTARVTSVDTASAMVKSLDELESGVEHGGPWVTRLNTAQLIAQAGDAEIARLKLRFPKRPGNRPHLVLSDGSLAQGWSRDVRCDKTVVLHRFRGLVDEPPLIPERILNLVPGLCPSCEREREWISVNHHYKAVLRDLARANCKTEPFVIRGEVL